MKINRAYEPPLFDKEDWVRFIDHYGNESTGEIRSIKTIYMTADYTHIYSIQKKFLGRFVHVGQESIIGLEPRP